MRIQFLVVVWFTGIIVLGLGFCLGVLLAGLLDAFDPCDPLAILRIGARRLRARRFCASNPADKGIAASREQTRSHKPTHTQSR